MALLAGATLLPRLASKPSLPLLSPPTTRRTHVVRARRGISSRTKKALSTVAQPAPGKEEAYKDSNLDETESGLDGVDNRYVLPELPGEEPDFWEGPQWDALGFFVQYMWAFGIVFALIACGIAVATYNGGATDLNKLPSIKSPSNHEICLMNQRVQMQMFLKAIPRRWHLALSRFFSWKSLKSAHHSVQARCKCWPLIVIYLVRS